MAALGKSKFFVASIICHSFILLFFILGLDLNTPLPVLENTNKNDVISAVVLGDSPKSKIIPKELTPEPESNAQKAKPVQTQQSNQDAIALQKAEKKKLADKKALDAKKQQELFAKELLADIKKHSEKQKKINQKMTETKFKKLLKEQAEKSLRQQLLNEKIKLQGIQNRQSQGEVNKYKALIIQAISEHWIIPSQANKKLYSELMIRLAPGGMVLDVQVIKTSGDPALDSSARAAVLKASPLPVPSEPSAFEPFRKFVLKVKPENIISNDPMLDAG